MRKKRLILALIVIFMTSQTQAMQMRDLVNTSSTKASKWTSPVTGEHYFYSGNFQFSFAGSKRYSPWFNASPPHISIGCSGVSIKDMFISMLGLEDIKEQLSSAGGQLAWGVMASFALSMPVLKDVFDELQKWARAIQKLLQNACKISQNYFKETFQKDAVQFAEEHLMNTSLGEAYKNFVNGSAGARNSFEKFVDGLVCGSYTGTAREQCLNKKSNSIAKRTNHLAKRGLTLISTYVGSGNIAQKPTNKVYISRLSSFLNSGKIGGYSLVSSNNIDLLRQQVLLSRIFFGDFALSTDSLKDILKTTNCSLRDNVRCEVDPQKLKEDMLAGYVGESELHFKEDYIPPVIASAQQAAKALVYGFDQLTNTQYCSNGVCRVQDNYVVFFDFTFTPGKDGQSSASIRHLTNVYAPDTATSQTLEVRWDGALKESYKKIKYLVKQKGGFDNGVGLFDGESVSAQDAPIPILVPGIERYIKLIVRIEQDAGAETFYSASLKNLLAKYNAYLFSNAMIDFIEGKVKQAMGGEPVGGSDKEQYSIILSQLRSITEMIKKELKEEVNLQSYNKLIVDIFRQIDHDRRTEISNSLR